MTKYYFTQDESSHWYMIPVELRNQWNDLYEKILTVGEYSDEWYFLIDEFDVIFSKYRTGGGISDIEFYIEEK